RNSRDPCLVIAPRRTLVSDSRCRGVIPAHEHNRSAVAKRSMSPISATNTAASTGPIPFELLDDAVAVMVGEVTGDPAVERDDLAVVHADELTQRPEPCRVPDRQVEGGELRGAARTEHLDRRWAARRDCPSP